MNMSVAATCPQCGVDLPAGAAQCPHCNTSPATTNLRDRALAVLCYFTPIPAIVFVFLKQYRSNTFVRFHAFQSIMVGAGVLALVLVGVLLANLGWTVAWLMFGVLFFVGLFFLWVVLSIKAAQGIRFELPFVGPLAAKRAAF